MWRGETLGSIGWSGVDWHPGENIASCLRDRLDPHEAPSEICGCGLYGLHRPRYAIRKWKVYTRIGSHSTRADKERYIAGAIAGSGMVEIHRRGWRAERAQIVALLRPNLRELDEEAVIKLAERYQVPLVENRKELREAGRARAAKCELPFRPRGSELRADDQLTD